MRALVLYLGFAYLALAQLALAQLASAQQSVSPDVVQHVQAGLQAQKQGRMNDAIREFKTVTELMPSLAAAWVNLGAAYLQDRNYGAAIAPLKQSLQLNPNLIGADQMLGYALLQQGYVSEAIPHLKKAGMVDALGVAEYKLGHYLEAITDLETALSKHPNDPDLLYYLGRASGLLSKQALDTLQSAYPDSARAHQALGENYAVLRRVPEAVKEYQDALRIAPKAPGIHLALGLVYAGEKDWPKAEEQFHAETEIQPGDAEAAYRYGDALLQIGNIKQARIELERADHLQPRMPQTLYALGKAASLAGDAGAAEKAWLHLLSIEKNTSLAAQAHFGLATLYRKQGKTTEASRQMEEFNRIHSANGEAETK